MRGSNFGRNTRPADADCSSEPADETELAALLAGGGGTSERYTVVGARHSWSEVVQGRCLLSLAKLDAIELLGDGGTVRVGAGARFGALQDVLHAANRSLPNYGAVNVQTVVGALLMETL